MNNKVLAVLTIIAILLGSLITLSATEQYIFSKDIYFNEFTKDGIGYYGNVSDGDKVIADLYFRVEHAQPNSNYQPMRVEWQPSSDIEIDAVTLRFIVPDGVNIYIETGYPGVPSIPYSFCHKIQNHHIYEITLNDLGSYGTGGSIPIKFIVNNLRNASQMILEAEFSMHYKAALQLSSMKAHAYIDALIPTDLPQSN